MRSVWTHGYDLEKKKGLKFNQPECVYRARGVAMTLKLRTLDRPRFRSPSISRVRLRWLQYDHK